MQVLGSWDAFSLHHLLSRSLSCSCAAAGQAGCPATLWVDRWNQASLPNPGSEGEGASEAPPSLCLYLLPRVKVVLLLLQNGSSQPDSLQRPHPLPASPRPACELLSLSQVYPRPLGWRGGSPSPPSCMAQKHFTLDFLAEEIRGQRALLAQERAGQVHPVKGQGKKHICSKPSYTAY